MKFTLSRLRHAVADNAESSVFPCRYYYDTGELWFVGLVRSDWTSFSVHRAVR